MKPKTDVSNISIDEVSIDCEDSPKLTLIELFHDPAGTAYATIATDSATLTVPVKSEAYKSFIRQQAFQAGDTLKQTEVRERTDRDSDEARFNGMEHEVYIRVGRYDGHVMTGLKAKAEPRLFIDLADDGRACEVTASGWTVVTHPACKFWRAAGMLPLPTPVKGDVHHLRRFVNLSNDDYVLFLTLLTAAFRFGRPTPITLITGEHGTGKTTLARIFRRLVDPSSAPTQTASNSERDLAIAARNSWVINIDNQSRISDTRSDNLCRLATGNGLRTRTLYTDADEQIFSATRPVLLNSIEELATRSDFLDRTVHHDLMIHELAHNTLNRNAHLKDIFYRTVQEIAGKLTVLALEEPELFVCQTGNGETYSFTAVQPIWEAAKSGD